MFFGSILRVETLYAYWKTTALGHMQKYTCMGFVVACFDSDFHILMPERLLLCPVPMPNHQSWSSSGASNCAWSQSTHHWVTTDLFRLMNLNLFFDYAYSTRVAGSKRVRMQSWAFQKWVVVDLIRHITFNILIVRLPVCLLLSNLRTSISSKL